MLPICAINFRLRHFVVWVNKCLSLTKTNRSDGYQVCAGSLLLTWRRKKLVVHVLPCHRSASFVSWCSTDSQFRQRFLPMMRALCVANCAVQLSRHFTIGPLRVLYGTIGCTFGRHGSPGFTLKLACHVLCARYVRDLPSRCRFTLRYLFCRWLAAVELELVIPIETNFLPLTRHETPVRRLVGRFDEQARWKCSTIRLLCTCLTQQISVQSV